MGLLLKNRKSPIHPARDWSCCKRTTRDSLCFGRFCALFSGHQHLTAIVQVAFMVVGVVEEVWLTGRFAGSNVWSFCLVVRAACALAALGVPPFRIWHDP